MEDGRIEAALAANRRWLELHPDRLDRLIGAARAAVAMGDQEAATSYAAPVQAGVRGSDRPGLRDAIGDMAVRTRGAGLDA